MPLNIPSFSDLRAQAVANLAARVPGADATLARATLPVIGNVVGAVAWAAYRALGWVSKQFFVVSAEAPYLDRRLGEVNLPRIQATVAAGNVVFSGVAGTLIPLATLVATADGAWSYVTAAAATIGGGGTISVGVTAQAAGSAGNQVAGAVLNVVTAIASVQATATVDTAGITGGTDPELDAAYRVRGLARLGQPPQGGAASDFLAWAKASGVPTRAWVLPLNRGPGTVDVAFTIDSRADNIPLAADVTAVQAAVNAAKPVIADCVVLAPTPDALAITVHGLVGSAGITLSVLEAAVTAQLQALVATVPLGGPSSGSTAISGDGVSVPLPLGALFPVQTPGTLYLSQIEAAIDAADGVVSFDLTAPAADVVFAAGHIPAAPTISFT